MCHVFPPSRMLMHITSNPLLASFFRCIVETGLHGCLFQQAELIAFISSHTSVSILFICLQQSFSTLSPHRKSLFWFRFWVFLPEFFLGDKLFIMPTLVVFFFWLIWVFVFFPNSKRSLDSGARCQDRKCSGVLSDSFFFQVYNSTQYKT